jgi:osmotically-inducible protein OsmY
LRVVGIVSRSNLMHALAALGRAAAPPAAGDAAIRRALLAEFDKESWAPVAMIDVVVKDRVVELWGTVTQESQREALKVAAENVPGVTRVESHLTWIDPLSGMVIDEPADAAL